MRPKIVIAALAVAALLALWLLNEGRGLPGGLVPLIGIPALALVLGRVVWRWWRAHSRELARAGLIVASGLAVLGWVTVALARGAKHISSENYIWIIVAPLLFLLGFFAIAGGVLGSCLGATVVVTSRTEPPSRKALLMSGGGAVVVLNVWHVVSLVRLLVTG